MSNFFEAELRRLFSDGEIIQNPTFVGRACLGNLDGDLRVRAEFVTMGVADQYEALRLTVLKRTDGEVDRLLIRFGEVFADGVSRAQFGKTPFMWTYRGVSEWYNFQPAAADYQALRRAAGNYLDVFRERTPDRASDAPARKPAKHTSKRKSGAER